MVFGRKKKPDEDIEFGKDVTLTEQQRQAMERDYLESLGQRYYMIKDDMESTLLWQNRRLRNMVPAFSPLNSLSNIDEREASIRRLKYKILLLKEKGYMNASKYAKGGSTLMSSLELRSRTIVSDAVGGWKGRVLTEQSKIIRTIVEKKKKGLFG